MELNQQNRKKLKALAHSLKPVVIIGQQGLKETIHNEIELALDFHQLIKVKISGADKEARTVLADTLSQKHNAYHVQTIGNIIILYRQNKKKDNLLLKVAQ